MGGRAADSVAGEVRLRRSSADVPTSDFITLGVVANRLDLWSVLLSPQPAEGVLALSSAGRNGRGKHSSRRRLVSEHPLETDLAVVCWRGAC